MPINSGVFGWGPRETRTVLSAVAFAVALGLIVADFMTWIELDVAAIFGLPLILVGATRNRALLWTLTGLLVATIFAVYALQIPSGKFALEETFFVNRALNAVSLLLLAGLLHLWIRAVATREVELTRFGGHLILWLQGVHDAQNPPAVPA